jgi:BirA family biotin operon repressor/biotin-[acetyl-CoA-carboxylase] ligase
VDSIISYPTPASVHSYIEEKEIARRSTAFPAEQVKSIFRYGEFVASTIHYFPTLTRGMEKAREMISSCENASCSFPSGKVIAAGSLDSGKGRFQRVWYAPEGGIWLTLSLVNTLLPESSRLLPLAAGAACCETLQEYGIGAKIKWVNDVHVAGRKVAGVLTETMIGPKSGEEYVLIGIGLNVNNASFPDELVNTAGSMRTIANKEYDINQVATDLLAKLAWNIGILYFEEEQYLSSIDSSETPSGFSFMKCWRELSDTIGRRVLFGFDVQKQPQYEADVIGVGDDGSLEMRLVDDGSLITEHAGEIVYLPGK